MPATVTAPNEERRRSIQRQAHPHCFACAPTATGGLGLEFRVGPGGGIAADWNCPAKFQGFDGLMHGGLIATLLDGAMVHALFARGVIARTAELSVRYRHPMRPGRPARVAAWLCSHTGPLYCLEAEVSQEGAVRASARGKFMADPA